MKTMNYLFALVFLFVLSACSSDNSSAVFDLQSTDYKGELVEERTIYLELDLHQFVLKRKLYQLNLELIRIEEEIESSEGYVSEELQENLEKVQRMIDDGQIDYERLSGLISDYRRGRGPGGSGNPCTEEDNISRCDLNLENASIYVFGREEIDVRFTNNDEECGELVDLVEVPEYEGQVYEMVLESEEGCADEIKISGVNAEGNKFSYSISIAQ